MIIGLVSDTHIPGAALLIPSKVLDVFRDVDLILHAGDIFSSRVLDDLQQVAPVIAARGDGDSGDVLRDSRVKWKHVLRVNGKTLWLIHEMPYPYPVPQWRARAIRMGAESDAPDIVVFGHDHCTIVERAGEVLLVNPGSPTFLNYRSGLGTVGIMDIDSKGARVTIVDLQPRSDLPHSAGN